MLRREADLLPYMLDVPRLSQPDDVSCGTTCLRQVLSSYGDQRTSEEILAATRRNTDGGTLGVFLGLAAIELGYRVRLYTYNLRVFDPTWFDMPVPALRRRLRRRLSFVRGKGLRREMRAWLDLLAEGGEIRFEELTPSLLISILRREHPLICGLSATYLYRQVRERPRDNVYDDVRGEPVGHFVVVCGYRQGARGFVVCDPWPHAPFEPGGRYEVPTHRLLNAILLGDVTSDAVLLEVYPEGDRRKPYETQ